MNTDVKNDMKSGRGILMLTLVHFAALPYHQIQRHWASP